MWAAAQPTVAGATPVSVAASPFGVLHSFQLEYSLATTIAPGPGHPWVSTK